MPEVPNHRKKLGDSIRRHRRAAKLSLEALAEKAELHPNYLGDVERGVENISIDALVRVAGGLNVAAQDLMQGI